jgi:septum formation protein
MRGVLYLASTSPRRRELLQDAALEFRLHPPGAEPQGSGVPRELAVQRARHKAIDAPQPADPGFILGVDTVVALGLREFGKPGHAAAARAMLLELSGREHEVWTGHCLFDPARGIAREHVDGAVVACQPLAEDRLEAYLATGDWVDKAGGYGIQGPAAAFMRLCAGDLDTVIGLHVATVRRLWAELVDGSGGAR